MLRLALLLAPLLAALVGAGRVQAAAPEPAWGRRAMVASSVGPAAAAGREILAAGGNAVDAAIAAGFAAGAAHPFSSGIGGGGFIVVRAGATGEIHAVDAREVAPAAAHERMFLREDGSVDAKASLLGGRAVAVPGLVQGLHELHARFGRLRWAKLLEPAIRMCREGVPIGPYHQAVLRQARADLEAFPETRRVQLAGGAVPPLGWRLVQRDLARTYEAIARQGPRALTEGRIAKAIVEAVQKEGGILAPEDFRAYRTRWRAPVRGSYRGYEVVSMPPPSSGGVHLIQMLNTLEPFDLESLGPGSSETIRLLAESMKLAFADRAAHLGDPAFHEVPVAWLTSKAYGLELAERIATPPAFWRRPPWRWGEPHLLRVEGPGVPPPGDAGTTHISAMDSEGNAVALTQTVNTLFGSGITVPGTGIVLNNEMDDFAAAPDAPNAWGLPGSGANAVAPGKRPLSSMTPTLVLREGEPWLVTGSPMGPMIITAVLQTLTNAIDFRMDAQQAVSAPRIHHPWIPDTLLVEPEHPRDVVERLRAMGYAVQSAPGRIGACATVVREPGSGLFRGGADPRRDTAALGY